MCSSDLHLTSELFRNAIGADLTHIPYKGAAPAMTDLLGGQIDLMFPGITPVVAHVKSGRLRALGLTSMKRSAALPDVPTMNEQGIKNFESIGWYGVLVPTGTPRAIMTRLNRELTAALSLPDLKEKLASQGADGLTSSPAELATFVQRELAKFAAIIKAAGVRVE